METRTNKIISVRGLIKFIIFMDKNVIVFTSFTTTMKFILSSVRFLDSESKERFRLIGFTTMRLIGFLTFSWTKINFFICTRLDKNQNLPIVRNFHGTTRCSFFHNKIIRKSPRGSASRTSKSIQARCSVHFEITTFYKNNS